MEGGHNKLAGLPIGPQDAEISNDDGRTSSAESQILATGAVAAMSHRGDEIEPFDEGAARLPDDHDDLLGRGRDLGCAACAGQPDLRVRVTADHRGVDVPIAI